MPVLRRARRGPSSARDRQSAGTRGALPLNLAILVVVGVAVLIAAILLAKTVSVAQRIDKKATNIAENGEGINTSTDSVMQLRRTNSLADSILTSARPLDSRLTRIVARARSIDGLATAIDNKAGTINASAETINSSAQTINSSAGSINSSAGPINASAREINTTAGAIGRSARGIDDVAGTINRTAKNINSSTGSIVRTAVLIDRDAAHINSALDVTIGVASAIKVDTGNILGQAVAAKDTAACIDRKLDGGGADTSDCQGLP